jgi:hypothetical protein
VPLAGDVVRHILRDGMRLMGVGVIVGLAGALGFSRFLESLRYQVRTYDPPTSDFPLQTSTSNFQLQTSLLQTSHVRRQTSAALSLV